MNSFKGIYTPIVTPFDENEEINYKSMKHNLDKWGETELDGIVVLGSNGEFCYLSEDEKIEVVKFSKENFNKNKKVIAGATCESTKHTIELSKKFADVGADAVLLLPPNYYKGSMKDDVLLDHFINVADKSPVPVMLYNMPGNTGINLSTNLIAKASKHKNIVGIKDTSGNIVQLEQIVKDTHDDFAVFAGNAGYLFPALCVGARGATLALANILPEDCIRIVKLYKNKEYEKARLLQLKMIAINNAVTNQFGIPALKAALDILGYKGGYVRRPLKQISEENLKILKSILSDYLA